MQLLHLPVCCSLQSKVSIRCIYGAPCISMRARQRWRQPPLTYNPIRQFISPPPPYILYNKTIDQPPSPYIQSNKTFVAGPWNPPAPGALNPSGGGVKPVAMGANCALAPCWSLPGTREAPSAVSGYRSTAVCGWGAASPVSSWRAS